MNAERPRPLFVDTGALYARFVSDDDNHDVAMSVFDGIRDGELPYRPLYTCWVFSVSLSPQRL
jgi:predicted nucleic acid-binding protein